LLLPCGGSPAGCVQVFILSRASADPNAFAAAITGLRQHSTPYHLAYGLLGHPAHLLRTGDDETAAAVTGEASGIAEQLRY
jgi:hypothetical protein